jgi:ParB family chromosome partitioning protein
MGQSTDASVSVVTAARRKLGRGLESLISIRQPVEIDAPLPERQAPASTPGEPTGDIVMVQVDQIAPNPDQPRQEFDEKALDALATSIRSAGLMQPVVVRRSAGPPPGYVLVVGERRWRAARRIGLREIPAIVRRIDDRTAAEWALIENIQREDLNPIERAEAFRKLVELHGLTHQQLADRVGLDRSTVTNFIRLNELDDFAREAVRSGRLTPGHAKALLSIGDDSARRTLADLCIRNGWTVRALERRAGALSSGGKPTGRATTPRLAPSAHLADLAGQIAQQLGTRVRIEQGRSRGSGRLLIEFFSLDQFDGLLARMGVKIRQ